MTTVKTNGLNRSPLHLLHRVAQFAAEIFSGELGDSDLTPRQLAVLMTVAENEGVSQTGIVDRTGIDRSTLSDIVRRLQKKGWVQRRRKKGDGRANTVTLTDKGRSQLRKAAPLVRKVDERILAGLPRRDGEQLIEQLATIVGELEARAKK